MKRLCISSLTLIFASVVSSAADTTSLSLRDCIDLALVHNLRHLSERREVERSQAQLREAKAPFELNANADFTLPSYAERRDTFDDVALTSRVREENTNFQYSGSVALSQRVRHLGQFTISTGGIRTQVNSNRRQDFRDYTGNVHFGYSQNLLATPNEELRLLVAKLNAEASYAEAETIIERRRDELREILGMEMTASLEVDTTVSYQRIPVDEASAIDVGVRQRTDLRDLEIQQRLDKLSLEQTRKRVGPSAVLNAGATLQGRGADVEEIPQNFERSLVSARIDVSLPLLDGGDRRGVIRQAEIALEQSQLSGEMQRQQIIREIRNSVRDVGDTERQIEIRRTALDVAERQYDVEEARFEIGIGDSQELLDAQTSVTDARIAHLTSIINYQRALGTLRVTTMADLSELVADAGG